MCVWGDVQSVYYVCPLEEQVRMPNQMKVDWNHLIRGGHLYPGTSTMVLYPMVASSLDRPNIFQFWQST